MTDTTDDAPNEILAAAKDAKAHQKAADAVVRDRHDTWPLVAIGVGIGSAAVSAAVLFANRKGSKKK